MFPARPKLSGLFLAALVVGCTLKSYGSELVHLRSGFDLEAQSHKEVGTAYSLQMTTGTVEVLKEDVLGFDVLPGVPGQSAPAAKGAPSDLVSLIESVAASQAGTPEFVRLVRSVAQIESALRTDAKSSKGATGLMQLMPATAKDLGVVPTDTRENVQGGAKYLKELLERYRNDSVLALAAYNAGPGAVQRYGGVPPYTETRKYIERVLRAYAGLQHTDLISK